MLPEDRSRRSAHLPASSEASKGSPQAGDLHLRERTLDRSQRKGRGAQTNDEASGEQHKVVCWSAEDPMWVAIGLPRILVVVLGERGLIGPEVVECWERGRLR